jgi:hypothetical protein
MRRSTLGATWLALALGPIAIGQAAVATGQSVGQSAAGQTVRQPGQCVAPGPTVAQSVDACAPPPPPLPVTAAAPPPSPSPPTTTSNYCAGLLNQANRAMNALQRLKASPKHSGRSYGRMLSAAKQKYAAAQKAANACRG